MKKSILIALATVVLLVAAYYFFPKPKVIAPVANIQSFADCVAAGYTVMESYPRQCVVPGVGSFSEEIGNQLAKQDLIRLETPQPNEVIASPLVIKGEARGYWFFEASFPVKLYDANNNEIALTPGYIMTDSDWMTNDFVPFEASLTFNPPSTSTGMLVLQKDNPSGLPENDDQLIIPVKF